MKSSTSKLKPQSSILVGDAFARIAIINRAILITLLAVWVLMLMISLYAYFFGVLKLTISQSAPICSNRSWR